MNEAAFIMVCCPVRRLLGGCLPLGAGGFILSVLWWGDDLRQDAEGCLCTA